MKNIVVLFGLFFVVTGSTLAQRNFMKSVEDDFSARDDSGLEIELDNVDFGLANRRGLFWKSESEPKFDPNPSSNPSNWHEDLAKEVVYILSTGAKAVTDIFKTRNTIQLTASITKAIPKIGRLAAKLIPLLTKTGLHLITEGGIKAIMDLGKIMYAFGKVMFFS